MMKTWVQNRPPQLHIQSPPVFRSIKGASSVLQWTFGHPKFIPALSYMFLGQAPDPLWTWPGWNSVENCIVSSITSFFLSWMDEHIWIVDIFCCLTVVYVSVVYVPNCCVSGGRCGWKIQWNTCTHTLLMHNTQWRITWMQDEGMIFQSFFIMSIIYSYLFPFLFLYNHFDESSTKLQHKEDGQIPPEEKSLRTQHFWLSTRVYVQVFIIYPPKQPPRCVHFEIRFSWRH